MSTTHLKVFSAKKFRTTSRALSNISIEEVSFFQTRLFLHSHRRSSSSSHVVPLQKGLLKSRRLALCQFQFERKGVELPGLWMDNNDRWHFHGLKIKTYQ